MSSVGIGPLALCVPLCDTGGEQYAAFCCVVDNSTLSAMEYRGFVAAGVLVLLSSLWLFLGFEPGWQDGTTWLAHVSASRVH